MARASAVIGLTMLGAAGAGAATIPFMGSPSVSGLRCDAHRFPTVQACQAAGHAACRPDGTNFVPANCSIGGGSGTSGTRWYNSHPIYWFGGGRGTTTSPTHSGPSTVTTTTRSGGSGGPTTSSPSARGGFGSSGTGHGGSSSS